MNNWIKSGLGVSAAGFIVLMATHGKQLAEALLALWQFVVQAGSTAPLGLVSFFASLSLAVLSRHFLRKWLPDYRCHLSREALIDLGGLAVGVTVVWVQMIDVPQTERIKSLWVGIMTGLMAPHVYNVLAAAGSLLGRAASKLSTKAE